MARVELCQVQKTFAGGTVAVRDLTLAVDHGDWLVLVGPSGSGKTTVLRMIAGLESPSRGQVLLDGRPADGQPPHRRGVGMVFQNYALYPHLTVRGNLAFPLRMRGVRRAERARRVAEMAAWTGLHELLDRRPAELSGGQQQRVAMARALIGRPEVCLMDEPLCELDPPLRAQIRSEIVRTLQKTGTTVLYVTHDQVEAMSLGQPIAVLRQGRLQQLGTGRELYDDPANVFVARFFGDPGANLLPGRLRPEGAGTWSVEVGSQRLPVPREFAGHHLARLAGQPVLVGLRPEALGPAVEAGPGAVRVRGRVVVADELGHGRIVYFRIPAWADGRAPVAVDGAVVETGDRVAARWPATGAPPRPGDELILHVNTAKMLLFDAAGRAIGRKPP